ncbi:hypothetical protein BDD12DRAFT_802795 [Trichophaea hybrida]|nr:hypothetical protein BDD12DRAFT_802795 [Trichophaea hybrida]
MNKTKQSGLQGAGCQVGCIRDLAQGPSLETAVYKQILYCSKPLISYFSFFTYPPTIQPPTRNPPPLRWPTNSIYERPRDPPPFPYLRGSSEEVIADLPPLHLASPAPTPRIGIVPRLTTTPVTPAISISPSGASSASSGSVAGHLSDDKSAPEETRDDDGDEEDDDV